MGIYQINFAQELLKTIPVNGKNLTNLSGAINDSLTFHILINKSNNVFNSKIFFIGTKKTINSLEIYNESYKPNYLSFHTNENTLTLMRESQDKKVIIEDIDYNTGKIDSHKLPFQAKKIFSHKNITFIIGQKFNKSLPFAFIKKATDTKIKLIKPKNKLEKSFFSVLRKKAEFVNDKQYLSNGPILEYKGFYNGKELIFTNDDSKKGITNIIYIKDSGTILSKKVPVRNKKELKRFNSFIKDSLLFTFKMYKTESFLDIHNVNSLEKLKTFRYTKSDFGPHNKIVMRGNDITNTYKPKKFYNDFTPQAIGSMYLPALNLAVNKTTKNEYIIKIGHLDKNSYQNNSTGNFWWSNNAYSLNYNMNSGAISFNTSGAQFMIFKALSDAKNTGNYFELNLNKSLDKVDDKKTYFYYEIEEKTYNSRLKNIMNLKNHYYINQKDYVRFINYDIDKKAYNIYNLSINKKK